MAADERILEKLRKVYALVERGEKGEAIAAKNQLEQMLAKYGLTLEDVAEEKRTKRTFLYKNNDERNIWITVVANTIGSKHPAFNASTFNRHYKTFCIELTEIEYIDILNAYEYYKRLYAKEKRSIMKNMMSAFVHKHGLFNLTQEESGEAPPMDAENIRIILTLMGSMSDAKYRKMIEI